MDKKNYPGYIKIVGGKWRGKNIPVTVDETLRPTPVRIRETLFNWLQADIVKARCLDLFAGSGALGLEALSRGANEVVFVEEHAATFAALKKMIKALQVESHCQLYHQDAMLWLKQHQLTEKHFDIIFLDPPFGSPLLPKIITLLDKGAMVGSQTLIYAETPLFLQPQDLPTQWQILKQKKASDVVYQLILGSQ